MQYLNFSVPPPENLIITEAELAKSVAQTASPEEPKYAKVEFRHKRGSRSSNGTPRRLRSRR